MGANSLTHEGSIVPEGSVLTIVGGRDENNKAALLSLIGDAAKVYLASLLAGEDLTNNVLGTVRKHPIVSTYSPSVSTSFGTTLTANAKATPGILKSLSVSSVNAAARYFQIFNTTGATTPLLLSFPIAAGSATVPSRIDIGEDILGENGLYLSTGITWGLSTTRDSYVAATAADHQVHLFYY